MEELLLRCSMALLVRWRKAAQGRLRVSSFLCRSAAHHSLPDTAGAILQCEGQSTGRGWRTAATLCAPHISAPMTGAPLILFIFMN